MTDLPNGYSRTGCRDGLIVCCRGKDFVRFTSGMSDDLGFVLTSCGLVPLSYYKKQATEIERLREELVWRRNHHDAHHFNACEAAEAGGEGSDAD